MELVKRVNHTYNPMNKTEVEKWARVDEEKLDIEILEDDEIIANITGQNQSSHDETNLSIKKFDQGTLDNSVQRSN